jgi:hypothetical protein
MAVDCLLARQIERLLLRKEQLKLDESVAITDSDSMDRLVWITCHD